MLRVWFLNVGHGDCTIIEHPSDRLTMVDINNSQEYDSQSYKDFAEEHREAARRPTNPISASLASGLGLADSGRRSSRLFGDLVSPAQPTGLGLAGSGRRSSRLFGDMVAPAQPTGPSLASLGGTQSPNFLGQLLAEMDVERAAAARELTDPVDFFLAKFPGRALHRFILTHPDLDHMRGIKRLFEKVPVNNFWDTGHTKPAPNFRSEQDREDWEFYQRLRHGYIPGPKVLFLYRGQRDFAYGADEFGRPGGDNIDIISPTPDLVNFCNAAHKSNDLSIVLRIRHKGQSVLLPGDAEDEAWNDMVATYGTWLTSDVLKGSHHGRKSGYHGEAVRLIGPSVVVVSVGRKPTTDAHNNYKYHCPNVWSTRWHGNIELQVDDNGQPSWFVDRNANK